MSLLQHFQFKSLFQDKRLPGWTFSFFHQQRKYEGIYHPNGKIEWTLSTPNEQEQTILQKQIHDLMLYHIYDQQR